MLRNSLRDQNYLATYEQMPRRVLTISSFLFVTLFTVASIGFAFYIYIVILGEKPLIDVPLAPIAAFYPVVLPLSLLFLYYALITLISKLFCESKRNNTKLRFIEKIKMPCCTCIEGLKVHQLLITYAVPTLIIFVVFPVLGGLTGDWTFTVMSFFCSMLIAPDFSLLLYILYLKIIKRPDYITIEDHLSSIVLFKR